MRILFEGCLISKNIDILPSNLSGLTDKNGKLRAVGYFYNPDYGYVVMLPNCYKEHRTWQKYYQKEVAVIPQTVSSTDLDQLWELQSSLHFTLERYKRELDDKHDEKDKEGKQNLAKMPDQGMSRDDSFLDVLIRIRQFYRRNSDYVFMIARSNYFSGNINWSETISHRAEIIINNGKGVFYPNPIYTRSEVDVDNKLFVIFLSIVDYIKKYGCRLSIYIEIDLLSSYEIERLTKEKRGCQMLNSIRDRYYSDLAVEMWQLCYDFFDRAVYISNKDSGNEYFLSTSFNLVFEKMVDTVFANKELKKKLSSSWAEIDHAFIYDDPVIAGKTIYILDSKYYEQNENSSNLNRNCSSVQKQKAYVDKVYNDAAESSDGKVEDIVLLDSKHNSHRFIPNCFILPTHENESEIISLFDIYEYSHWPHKPLFDITTKYIFCFKLSLPVLIQKYVSSLSEVSDTRTLVQKRICTAIRDKISGIYKCCNPSSASEKRELFASGNNVYCYKKI